MQEPNLELGDLTSQSTSCYPDLRYIPLPKPNGPEKRLWGDARLHRDIAVIKNHIKYVELQVNLLFCGYCHYLADGWTAKTFSMPVAAADSVSAANSDADGWSKECEVKSSDEINVDSNPHFELLPKLLDNEGRPLPPFKSIIVCQPTLSLVKHEHLVYFMVKDVPWGDKGWVIVVDMNKKKLVGSAEFAAERTGVAGFTYVHSRLSKYLTGAAGANGKPQ